MKSFFIIIMRNRNMSHVDNVKSCGASAFYISLITFIVVWLDTPKYLVYGTFYRFKIGLIYVEISAIF